MSDDIGLWIIGILFVIAIVFFLIIIPLGAYGDGITRGQCEGLGWDKRATGGGTTLCCNHTESIGLHCESIDYLLKTRGEME